MNPTNPRNRLYNSRLLSHHVTTCHVDRGSSTRLKKDKARRRLMINIMFSIIASKFYRVATNTSHQRQSACVAGTLSDCMCLTNGGLIGVRFFVKIKVLKTSLVYLFFLASMVPISKAFSQSFGNTSLRLFAFFLESKAPLRT